MKKLIFIMAPVTNVNYLDINLDKTVQIIEIKIKKMLQGIFFSYLHDVSAIAGFCRTVPKSKKVIYGIVLPELAGQKQTDAINLTLSIP